jgi:mRNA-degrading endonuclease RelE of RelBE toxin-antitoxin system
MNIDTTTINKSLEKLKRKDPVLFAAVQKKIIQISELNAADIHHFKNLRGNLGDYKRVHVGSFVLMFKVEGDIVIFDKFMHHDDAY